MNIKFQGDQGPKAKLEAIVHLAGDHITGQFPWLGITDNNVSRCSVTCVLVHTVHGNRPPPRKKQHMFN